MQGFRHADVQMVLQMPANEASATPCEHFRVLCNETADRRLPSPRSGRPLGNVGNHRAQAGAAHKAVRIRFYLYISVLASRAHRCDLVAFERQMHEGVPAGIAAAVGGGHVDYPAFRRVSAADLTTSYRSVGPMPCRSAMSRSDSEAAAEIFFVFRAAISAWTSRP
jgi:hypothetical protein